MLCCSALPSPACTHCAAFSLARGTRYYVAKDWTPKKLEVLVDMPPTLDLERLRAQGVQLGEQPQPEDPPEAQGGPLPTTPDAPPAVQPSPELVSQLTAMGFSENGSKRAAVATQVGCVAGKPVGAHVCGVAPSCIGL